MTEGLFGLSSIVSSLTSFQHQCPKLDGEFTVCSCLHFVIKKYIVLGESQKQSCSRSLSKLHRLLDQQQLPHSLQRSLHEDVESFFHLVKSWQKGHHHRRRYLWTLCREDISSNQSECRPNHCRCGQQRRRSMECVTSVCRLGGRSPFSRLRVL